MDYYKKKLFIPQVNKNDEIIGKIERWQAHKEAVLHRGFTAIIKQQNNIILQKRRHLIFDGFFDLSFSSHPVFAKNRWQTMEEAITQALKREWFIYNKEKLEIKFLEKYYYLAKDIKSSYFEHEINYLFLIETTEKIENNPQFSYQIKKININQLLKDFNQINLAPWIKKNILERFKKELQ